MNEVAKKAAEKQKKETKTEDAKKFIRFIKNHGSDFKATIQETMDMYDDVFNLDKVTKLVNEVYQEN